MALRAARGKSGCGGEFEIAGAERGEDLCATLMQHPPASGGGGSHAWSGAAPAAGAASSRGRRLGASYTDADAAAFRLHYDAVGQYFAGRVQAAAGPRSDPSASSEPLPSEPPPPSNSAAAHWARTPLGRFTPRTVELVTSLAAFRIGLQASASVAAAAAHPGPCEAPRLPCLSTV